MLSAITRISQEFNYLHINSHTEICYSTIIQEKLGSQDIIPNFKYVFSTQPLQVIYKDSNAYIVAGTCSIIARRVFAPCMLCSNMLCCDERDVEIDAHYKLICLIPSNVINICQFCGIFAKTHWLRLIVRLFFPLADQCVFN